MLPIKCLFYHRNNVVSRCPIKICVITVVILGVLPLMTVLALENIKTPKFASIQMSNYYLPSDTVTESQKSPRLLNAVTKPSSTSGTTSTVRPWPSHSFFRSVLSKSDNVVIKNRNGSKTSRNAHEGEAGISAYIVSNSQLKTHNHSNVTLQSNHEGNNINKKKTSKKYRIQRKRHDSNGRQANKSVSTAVVTSNEIQITSSENNTRARSVIIAKSSEIVPQNASVETERTFSQPLSPNEKQMETILTSTSINTNGSNQQTENVTKLSQPKNFIQTPDNEYSHINSPQVGFQYEILVPPPSPPLPPRPTLSKLTENATLNHKPISTTAILTTLEEHSHLLSHNNDSSGSNSSSSIGGGSIAGEEEGNENNRNTSNSTISAVKVNDMGKKVTNDDTTTTPSPTPPLPLESQVEGSEKNAETAVAPTLLPAPSSPYNKSNEIILQNLQYPSQSSSSLLPTPPTQPPPPPPPKLDDINLVKNEQSFTSNNKSHLPSSVVKANLENVNEIHTEIKKNDPWTINHYSDSNSDSLNKASFLEAATSLPLLKKYDSKQNFSSVSTLTGSSPINSPTTTIRTITTSTVYRTTRPTYALMNTQPTHFSFRPTEHSIPDQTQMEETSTFNWNKPNHQTFQKRISQHKDDHHRNKKINSVNTNYATIERQENVRKNQIAFISRRNMFTVVKAGTTNNTRLHVESRNTSTRAPGPNRKPTTMKTKFSGYPLDTVLLDRTNQVERPSLTTSILTGPDRMMVVSASIPGYPDDKKDNDYFDEDDTQAKLHHWIESEQGHFVSPSTELPRFTNLTWPYNIPSSGSDSIKNFPGNGGVDATRNEANVKAPASTALAVSFNSLRKDKPDFNSQFEFYIPSAAADPNQNPILLAKKQSNKTAVLDTNESWTRVPTPTIETLTTIKQENWNQDSNNLKQSDHKSKIKHSHWGSKGLSSIKRQNSQQKVKSSSSTKQQHNNMKVYESSTGNPKSSPSLSTFSPPAAFTKAPGANTFSIFSNKHKQYVFTSPASSSLGSSWPFDGAPNDGMLGQTETASFVTSKTPTNIWYKPIINHFTASVPFNGTTAMFDNANDRIFNNAHGIGGAIIATTMQPPSTRRKGYVGGGDADDDTFSVNNNKKDKTIPGKFSNNRRNATSPEGDNDDGSKSRILFKVWNFVDGKLKLENQREIPAWALHGYVIPASGTILNLQQIPPAIQPLVTSAMTMNKPTDCQNASSSNNDLAYVWKQLPIFGSYGGISSTISSFMEKIATTEKSTMITAATASATSSYTPNESSLDKDSSNQIKIAANKLGWEAEEAEVMHSSSNSKQPISINYILWNNPASIYGQSIILSTPTPPQTLLSHRPTPVSYFPSSTITSSVENTSQQQQFPLPSVVTIRNPGSSSGSDVTTTTPRTSQTINMDQEKLELLFQNYFQYFITTSTPAPTTTTSTTTARPPVSVSLANKVTETYGGQADNRKAWKDLKKLILRLASTKTDHTTGDNNKDSVTLDKDKTEDLDYLGNVAAIALIMSYLRNQYEQQGSVTTSHSTTPITPYGVTDDMTPPNKDQLWATVYPLFQHFLNNPNYTFIPPPPQSSNQQLLSSSTASMTPTSPGPINPFTEPLNSITGSSNNNNNNYGLNTDEYNHYASYYPTITTPRSTSSVSHISITEVPKHGQTTQHSSRSDEELLYDESQEEVDNYLEPEWEKTTTTTTTTSKPKTGLRFKKPKKTTKKTKKNHRKKNSKNPLLRSTLLKKAGLGPLFNLKKKQKKYWLDLTFEIDFIQILKKKLLFLLAYKYMPVAMVLAFGLIPIVLSLVPLLYKFFWMKWKKPKYIKVKVPVPYPSPFPVPVYKAPPPPPPYFHGPHHGNQHHSPIEEHFHGPEIRYENGHVHHNDDGIHDNSPPEPIIMDHHYSADTTGHDNSNEDFNYAHRNSPLPSRENNAGGYLEGVLNSFNYDYTKHSTPTTAHAGNPFQRYPYGYHPKSNEDQEVHVHLHDDESRLNPQLQHAPVTHFPSTPGAYTSYTRKDLQPYPVRNTYETGFDLGKTLAGITNKHDMEIFKILVETKKEKLNKLLDMWNLAKYGAAVASEAAVNAIRGPTTPSYDNGQHAAKKRKKRKRRRRRKKRKHSPNEDPSLPSSKLTIANHRNNVTNLQS